MKMHLPLIATTKNMQWPLRISKSSLEEEENLSDNPTMTRRTFERPKEWDRDRKTEEGGGREDCEGSSDNGLMSNMFQRVRGQGSRGSRPILDGSTDSTKEEICLMAHENEVLSDTPYYSSSSLDNESRQNKYDKLCKISLRIINKNKHLKAKNELLKRDANELKIKLELLDKNKEISNKCDVCNKLEIEINSLKLKLASLENSSSSLQKMAEMQKLSKDKCGLGYTKNIASFSNTKIKNLVPQIQKMPSVESALPVPLTTEVACSDEQHRASVDSAENGKNA
ncbi:hypothetical protein Tco_0774411 [Tanacetum coccineum]|uniref:Uncharacterized protein n=1 Tax=Tanacetum coccineum TaxID=301880 RepID=A0ABQ4ZPB3_9ASTR